MSALRFTEISVRRAPGCARGWHLKQLSPGINVIFGPNASGKTTTARALTSVLWPSKAGNSTETEGEFLIGDQTWHAELHGTAASYQRNGSPESRLALPAVESLSERCNISLHDLLRLDDRDVARAILLEAAGNYNVDAAGQSLKVDSYPKWRRGSGEDFENAKDEIQRLRLARTQLKADSDRLGGLEDDLGNARAADSRARLLIQAAQKRRDLDAYEAARADLEKFDSRLASLNGGEVTELTEKQRVVGVTRADLAAAKDALESADEQIAECRLPLAGVDANVLSSLQTRLEHLRSLEARLEQLQGTSGGAHASEEAALRALGGIAKPKAPDLPDLNEVAALVQEWTAVGLKKAGAEEWRNWLGGETPAEDLETLRTAELLLEQWLRSPRPTKPAMPRWQKGSLLSIACVIAAGSIAFALTLSPVAWLGVLAAFALVLIAFVQPREIIASLPPNLPSGVEPPESWDDSAVQRRLDEIRLLLRKTNLAVERYKQYNASESSWKTLVEREAKLRANIAEFAQKLECDINPTLFSLFIENVREAQTARRAAATADAEVSTVKEHHNKELLAIAAALEAFGIDPPKDYAQATGQIVDLAARDSKWRNAQREKGTRSREYQNLERQCEDYSTAIGALLKRTEVEDVAALAVLLENFHSFTEARARERSLGALRDQAMDFFQEHPELEQQMVPDLEREQAEAAEKAQRLEEIIATRSTIVAKIRQAEHQTDLESAVERRETARQRLLADRDSQLDALSGYLVLDYVRRQMGEFSMPNVFARAQDLFARFTNHRWQLVAPDEAHNFRARETAGGATRPLEALSSGTRVQLLMAVRAASVESEEHGFGLQLPLLFDETLANSDDERAQDIIAAIAELAREGRQIFYFTAQSDERAKWLTFLTKADVPHKILDLSDARGETSVADFERITAPPPLVVPPPEGQSREEYGVRLGVPRLDPRDDIGSVHLWHVCEDTATLHRLLQLGLEQWGQLEDALKYRGDELLGDGADRVRANARLIQKLFESWRHGRGRPLVREALIEAKITAKFIDSVWELARKVEFDAARLLQALESGDVTHFRGRAVENLRQHCLDHGYLSGESPLSPDTIRHRLRLAALDLSLSSDRADALLATLSDS